MAQKRSKQCFLRMGGGILLVVFMGILVVCVLLLQLGKEGQEGARRSPQLRDWHAIRCLMGVGLKKAKPGNVFWQSG